MLRSLFTLLVALWAPVTFGLDFKGLTIGVPGVGHGAVQKLGLKCEPDNGGQLCKGRLTIALEPARAEVAVSPDGTIISFELLTGTQRFEDIQRAIVARYGSPSDEEVNSTQNRRGEQFKQINLMWVGEQVHIKITKFVLDATQTRIWFGIDPKLSRLFHERARQVADL